MKQINPGQQSSSLPAQLEPEGRHFVAAVVSISELAVADPSRNVMSAINSFIFSEIIVDRRDSNSVF